MTIPSFEQLYADVPEDQRDRLARFRAEHPVVKADVNGVTWEYIDAGSGDEVILLLVGGYRAADAAFRSIPLLKDDFRVITPTYPGHDTMAGLADGLAGLLDALGVDACYVLAGSFGGMLAQVFVRRHSGRVKKLVLSTTAILDDESITRYWDILNLLEPLPDEQVSHLAAEQMLETAAPPAAERAFWRAYLHELFTYRVNKRELLSTFRCLIDFAENHHLAPGDLSDWPGEMLILESDDDATFDEAMRAAVRERYPQAQTHVFHNAGHSPATTQRETYFKVVRDFLRG